MATSSIFVDIKINSEEKANDFIEALEKSEQSIFHEPKIESNVIVKTDDETLKKLFEKRFATK